MDRLAKTMPALAGVLLVIVAVVVPTGPGSAQPQRQSLDILTGPPAGSDFPIGELIARVISHPPGLARCERSGVCAPSGIIVSARTSDGAVANVLAVNDGTAASGLALAPVVADAVAGRGAFRKQGRQTHIRVMADLFSQTVQILARPDIDRLTKLKGKRVAVGGAGADVVAGEILAGLRIKVVRGDNLDSAAAKLRDGRVDAAVVIDDAPSPVVADLLAKGTARIVPIGGALRTRFIARVPGLLPETVSYRGSGPIDTVAVRTLWIVNDQAPTETVYGLVRALYNPANRDVLAQGPHPAQDIRLGERASLTLVPLHPGAIRFYREAGQLPPPQKR
jgi:TRAP transporter TAXI family solute receptor